MDPGRATDTVNCRPEEAEPSSSSTLAFLCAWKTFLSSSPSSSLFLLFFSSWLMSLSFLSLFRSFFLLMASASVSSVLLSLFLLALPSSLLLLSMAPIRT